MIAFIKVWNIYDIEKKINPKAIKTITYIHQRYYYEKSAVYAVYTNFPSYNKYYYEEKASICNYICICNSKNKRKNINKSTIKNHTIADNYLEYDFS